MRINKSGYMPISCAAKSTGLTHQHILNLARKGEIGEYKFGENGEILVREVDIRKRYNQFNSLKTLGWKTLQEASDILGTSISSTRRMIRDGILLSMKVRAPGQNGVWLIDPASIEIQADLQDGKDAYIPIAHAVKLTNMGEDRIRGLAKSGVLRYKTVRLGFNYTTCVSHRHLMSIVKDMAESGNKPSPSMVRKRNFELMVKDVDSLEHYPTPVEIESIIRPPFTASAVVSLIETRPYRGMEELKKYARER